MKKRVMQGGLFFLAFLGTYGFGYLLRLMGVERPHYTITNLFLFAASFFLLTRTGEELEEAESRKQKRHRIIYSFIIAFLFSVSMIMGYQLQKTGMTEGGFRGKGLILFRGLCLSVIVFPFVQFLFARAERIREWRLSAKETQPLRPVIIFAICAGIIFLCLIPVWLAYYPIIMSYDFHRQINEAYRGFELFYPYQPIAHTWMIWLFWQIGNLLGSPQSGMACMALFQILLYSLTAGYACTFLYRVVRKIWPVVLGVFFFGIFPLNSVLVLCTTKDVMFSILFLLFVLLLSERTFFAKERTKLIIDVLMVLEGCLMTQFRNNAWYALAVFAVSFFALSPRKEKIRVFLLCVLLLAGSKGMAAGIKAAIGTKMDAPKSEMYSVPIQQFARVGVRHGQELDRETYKRLVYYLNEEVWDAYNPPISDTVKINMDSEGFGNETDLMRLLSDWLYIGARYPNEFLDAFLELTRGYWFWDDVSWAEVLGSGVEGRMGAIYTYNSSELMDTGESIEHESKFPWLETQLEKIVSGNYFYDWPFFSVFFKCAFYSWGLFILTVMFLYLRQRRQLMICMFPFMYFGTMLLGPVVCLRYITPIILTLPVLVSLGFMKEEEDL